MTDVQTYNKIFVHHFIVLFDSDLYKIPAIMKTRLYSFDPLKPHVYTVKLGFTGVNINFHISAQNIDCRYSLESVLTNTHNLCFEQKYENYQNFSFESFHFFLLVNFSL